MNTCLLQIVAIGGGGFIPARMLRTVVKKPILAVTLELYESTEPSSEAPIPGVETSPGKKVRRIQWFDEDSEAPLLYLHAHDLVVGPGCNMSWCVAQVGSQVRGKKVLVVDEVDDTRTTLQFCVEVPSLLACSMKLCF